MLDKVRLGYVSLVKVKIIFGSIDYVRLGEIKLD
jgi:hypothetical protein